MKKRKKYKQDKIVFDAKILSDEMRLVLVIMLFPLFLFGQEKNTPPFINEYVAGGNYAMVSNHNTTGKIGGFFEFRREFNASENTKFILGFSYSYTSQYKDTISEEGINTYYGNYYYDVGIGMHKVYFPILLRNFFVSDRLFIEGGVNFNAISILTAKGWSHVGFIQPHAGTTSSKDLPYTEYTEHISLGQPRWFHFHLSIGGIVKSFNKYDLSLLVSYVFSGNVKTEFSSYSDNNLRLGLVLSTNKNQK